MNLNELKYTDGARQDRMRRRGGSKGKTCGKGHKGQSARSGASIPARREGGQTPLYRRLPKFGFTSRVSLTHAKLPLSVIASVPDELVGTISVDLLKALDLIPNSVKTVKIYLSGNDDRAFSFLPDVLVTKGVRALMEERNKIAS